MNTLFGELKRDEALPIWNKITPLGDPPEPFVVADKFCMEEGQYQSPQGFRVLRELALKNSPFEPLSMKLSL
jgi:hypothetical protein